jgi:hypothetical protein
MRRVRHRDRWPRNAHTIALCLLHAAALGCRWMVEDILDKARAEHGHMIATAAFDEQLMAESKWRSSASPQAPESLVYKSRNLRSVIGRAHGFEA